MTALHELTVAELRQSFAAGALRPSVYLDHLLRRLDMHDGAVGSLTRLDAEGAIRAATVADATYAAGRPRGPLEGIPVAVKDVMDVAGMPTTCHSRILRDNIASRDAAAVARLREAGAILLGKAATHEFAIGGPAFDLPWPPARNPWSLDHHPGGSSSGCGAGVAAGLFPAAVGTDTGGSVRHPASACGIAGLKPTYDAIPRDGVFPLSFSLDHVGSLARTVADAALLCDVMAAGATTAGRLIGRPVAGIRVGYVRHFHEVDMPAVPEVTAALDGAAARLAALGAEVCEVTLPSLLSFAAVNRIVLHCEAIAVHGAWLRQRPQDYCALSRRALLAGAFHTAEDLVQAQRRRRQLVEAVEGALRRVDVLLTASSMEPPCRIDDAVEVARSYGRQARTPFNVTGHPAIAIRSGTSSQGLPLSLQVAGRFFGEDAVCQVADAIELPVSLPSLAPRPAPACEA